MARPSKNNAEFFGHDANMRNHRKIKALRSKFGITGYAIWVMFLEILTESENNRIVNNDLEIELMAGDIGVSVTEITEMLNYCIKLELLFTDGDTIYSKTLDEKLKPVYEKRELARKRYESQTSKTPNQDDEGVSVTETTQSKGKGKGKVKENKKEEINISFDEFWNAYGKKEDRVNSEKKWNSLSQADREKVMADIPAYKKSKPDKQFRKNPLTYLNGKCWLDREGEVPNSQTPQTTEQNDDEMLAPEVLEERIKRRAYHASQMKIGVINLEGRIEFPESMSYYHKFRGLPDELETIPREEIERMAYGY